MFLFLTLDFVICTQLRREESLPPGVASSGKQRTESILKGPLLVLGPPTFTSTQKRKPWTHQRPGAYTSCVQFIIYYNKKGEYFLCLALSELISWSLEKNPTRTGQVVTGAHVHPPEESRRRDQTFSPSVSASHSTAWNTSRTAESWA